MSSVTDVQLWLHSENIHKQLLNVANDKDNNNSEFIDNFLDKKFVATEKLDGSNLGIHINGKTCTIEHLIGRNVPIFKADGLKNNLYDLKYGNAGALEKLPMQMLEFGLIMTEMLKNPNIIIYGEVYRHAGQKFASWHPFGCKLFDTSSNKWEILLLNSNLHEMFINASKKLNSKLIIHKNHDDIITLLIKSTHHLIFPPPILFVGDLNSIINNLYEMIRFTNNKDFEGCFIVSEDNKYGFKWKTSMHDEQKRIPKITDFNFTKESSSVSYNKLVDIFTNKEQSTNLIKHNDAVTRKKNINELTEAYIKECSETLIHVMSKHISFVNIEKKDRVILCEQIMKETIDEIKQRYTESEIICPYPDEFMAKNTLSIVKQYIMKIPYIADKSNNKH